MKCPCKSDVQYTTVSVNKAQLGVFKGRYTKSESVGKLSPANTYPSTLMVGAELKTFIPGLYSWADKDNQDLTDAAKWDAYRYDKVGVGCE